MLGGRASGFTHLDDELARGFRAGEESRVDERPEAGVAEVEPAGGLGAHGDGARGTDKGAGAAALAAPRVDGAVADGGELADLGAAAALGAGISVHDGEVRAGVGAVFELSGGEKEMEVRGIDVSVGEDLGGRERGERSDDRGLAGAALAADDEEFLHARNPFSISAYTPRSLSPYSGKASVRGSPRE